MKTRSCPICNSSKSTVIYTQKFANHFFHNIVSCEECGFVYVNNTPGQKYYNHYYKTMSKYEHERDQDLHEEYVKIIKKFCDEKAKILDIGCSTGHLLYLLKKQGFKNVSGIDPSPACQQIALKDFRLRIETNNLDSYFPKEKFHLIILTAILEHLDKVKESITKTTSLLSDNGQVFISIPDANNFYIDFDEPFGEFSTEHINFFSESSLYQLMLNYSCQYISTDKKVIISVWQKGNELKRSISKYVYLSNLKMKKITKVIDYLPKQIMVWGAGSLTQRLLKSTKLLSKVFKFIDINKNLIGKKIAGKEIILPGKLKNYSQPIFISTFRFKDEIVDYIKSHQIKNKIITISD